MSTKYKVLHDLPFFFSFLYNVVLVFGDCPPELWKNLGMEQDLG